MLKFDVSRVLLMKGIGRPGVYLRKLGYTPGKASRLVNGTTASINLYDLEQICLRLNCTPNDLLDWSPSDSEDDIANHALQSIRRKEAAVGLVALVQGLPVEKMQAIEKLILENIGEKNAK